MPNKKSNVCIITNPTIIATTGDAISEMTIFPMPFQFKPDEPTEIKTAPTSPPTRACDELDGIPKRQVTKFQIIAPTSAAIIIFSSTTCGELTMSPPIVFATPVEIIAPKKFRIAAMKIALLG